MSWWNHYIGIPYAEDGASRAGVDCRGLVRLVWQEQLGRDDFPAYAMISAADLVAASAKIIDEMRSGKWRWVAAGEEQAFDVAVIHRIARVNGHFQWGPFHLGIVTDAAHVLHCDEATGTVRMCFRDTPLHHRHPSWGRQKFTCWRRVA